MANGRQARAEANRTAGAFTGLGKTMARLGAAGGLTALAYGAARFAKASVDLEAKYSQTMATIQAATGATSRQIAKLNDLAIKLGQDTAFSANDAAEAMLELSKAGITTRDIMGGGVAGTLQLAAAGGTELGTAATIASNAMNAFNLAGRDMDRIAAALAGGANASTASVESLGQALSQVGPGAVNAGLSLNETVGALSAFDAAGVKGSDAGTSLKTMLARLVPQTTKASDAMEKLGLDFVKGNGEFESLTNIAGQLQQRLGKLSAAQRTTALTTIFGSDASRAATVLMRQGADGIRTYIRAAQDQNAAQEMAEARMSGTAGALERLSGSVETAQLRLGQELAPAVQDVSDALADNMVPAMEGAIDAGKTFVDAVEPAAKVLKELGETTIDVVQAVDSLPGPVKEVGIQAGIAALILPRLTAGVTTVTGALTLNIVRLQQWRAEMTYAATRAQQVSAAMTRMAGAAKTAAGIGGMVALTQATQNTDRAQSALLSTLGGAALGLSVGGPWGAAVGGAGGLLYGLTRKTDDARGATATFAGAMANAQQDAADYASSLDQVTGAVQRQTRAVAAQKLQEDGALSSARDLGIATRDLVSAALGQEAAVERVNAAVRRQEQRLVRLGEAGRLTDGEYQRVIGSLENLLGSLAWQERALGRASRRTREAGQATQTWGQALKGIPKDVRVALRQRGFSAGIKQIRALGREYDLTPEQIRTIIRITGAARAQGQAKGTRKALEDVGRAKPNLTTWERGLTSALTSGKRSAVRGGEEVRRGIEDGPKKARADLSLYTGSVRSGTGPAKSAASEGGRQVGANLKSGVITGFAGTAAILAAQAAAAVRSAVAAARAAAKIKSPSQVMRDKVGVPLAQGITVGFIKGVKQGSSGISQALDKVTRLIEDRLSGKKYAGRRKALLKSLKDERAALVANGKAQEKVNRQLERAEQRYKSLRQSADQFAKSVKSGFQTYGSVVGLGTTGDSSIVTLPALLSQLTARASIAEQFNDVISSLRGKLNRTSLRQLLDQAASGDLESALATAQAIASGEQGTIRQINQLTAQITAAGEKLGKKMRREFFGHGLEIAEGTVKGLEKRQRELDRIAAKLAKAFLKEAGLYAGSGGGGGGKNKTVVVAPSSKALDTYLATKPTSDGGGNTYNITVNIPPGGNLIEAGRQMTEAIDAYESAGGRRRVRRR